MSQLDTDAEGEDSQEHGPGLHLTHCLKQSTREPESMKQPKEERRSESIPAPGSGRPEKILRLGARRPRSPTMVMLSARWWPPNCNIHGSFSDGIPRSEI